MGVDLPNAFTVLGLSGIGVAPYSARGLSQSIKPIEQTSQLVRTITGELLDLSEEQMRKYAITLTCTDMRAPAFGGLWPGMAVTVDCVAEMGNGDLSSDRPAVGGSSYSEDGINYFRPQIACRVVSFEWNDDEYGEAIGWTLELVEI